MSVKKSKLLFILENGVLQLKLLLLVKVSFANCCLKQEGKIGENSVQYNKRRRNMYNNNM